MVSLPLIYHLCTVAALLRRRVFQTSFQVPTLKWSKWSTGNSPWKTHGLKSLRERAIPDAFGKLLEGLSRVRGLGNPLGAARA